MFKLCCFILVLVIVVSLFLVVCDWLVELVVGVIVLVDVVFVVVKLMLGSFGFDVSGMDCSIVVGDDFFGFVNGIWVKNIEILVDCLCFGSFNVIVEKILVDICVILEGVVGNIQVSGDDKLIGDYYVVYMDEVGIEQCGVVFVELQLKVIDVIVDKVGLVCVFGGDLCVDVDLFNVINFYIDCLFGLWVLVDLLQFDCNVFYLVQGGLGMFDCDFYLGGGCMVELCKQYQVYIVQMLQLVGVVDLVGKV